MLSLGVRLRWLGSLCRRGRLRRWRPSPGRGDCSVRLRPRHVERRRGYYREGKGVSFEIRDCILWVLAYRSLCWRNGDPGTSWLDNDKNPDVRLVAGYSRLSLADSMVAAGYWLFIRSTARLLTFHTECCCQSFEMRRLIGPSNGRGREPKACLVRGIVYPARLALAADGSGSVSGVDPCNVWVDTYFSQRKNSCPNPSSLSPPYLLLNVASIICNRS